ncbi:hypothetical protein BJ742DRAFT_301852 [Cladochytrium replicatum]|nr:hypothetical protein BJ742DRAFT_301852 [Cladochytrium replicatum]
MDIDMALDDLIAQDKSHRKKSSNAGSRLRQTSSSRNSKVNRSNGPRRSGGGGGGGRNRSSLHGRPDINEPWQHDRASGNGNRAAGGDSGATLKVANLHYEVTEADLRDLFSPIGELNSVRIQFDRAGRSEGVATIRFARKSDATAAQRQYDSVEFDNLPMQITLVEPANAKGGRQNAGRSTKGIVGRAARTRSGGVGKLEKPAATKESLDSEMDAYMAGTDDTMDLSDGPAVKITGILPTERPIVAYDTALPPVGDN